MRARVIKTCGIAGIINKVPLITDLLRKDLTAAYFREENWEEKLQVKIFTILGNLFFGKKFEQKIDMIEEDKEVGFLHSDYENPLF